MDQFEQAVSKAVAAIEDEANRIKNMTLGTRIECGECLDDKNNPSMREILVALKALGVKFGEGDGDTWAKSAHADLIPVSLNKDKNP